jgi:hypothetical protein
MRFKVVGQNRDTGARMTLEFEAESKAAAERKATQAGMSVHHVADVTDGHASGQSVNPDYRGPVRPRSNGMIKLLILIAILAAIAIYYWPRLSHMMHR